MKPITDPHIARFSFAGFAWPRYVATLTTLSGLRKKREERRFTSGYYHAPKPNSDNGRGFYLSDAGQPFTRWQWCDDVEGVNIDHTGWFTDPHGDGNTIRGIVVLLPHGRFMAGWSMGKGMASTLEPRIFDCIEDAASMADDYARVAAEREVDYWHETEEQDHD